MVAQPCTNLRVKTKNLIYRLLDFKISAQIMNIVVQIRLILCKSKYLCRICANLCGLSATKAVFVQTQKSSFYRHFERFVQCCAVLCRHFLAHARIIMKGKKKGPRRFTAAETRQKTHAMIKWLIHQKMSPCLYSSFFSSFSSSCSSISSACREVNRSRRRPYRFFRNS